MKHSIILFLVLIGFSSFAGGPKNIILFIGDGMSVPQRMTAEEFARKAGAKELVLNKLPYQAITRTCSSDSLVTDSAAAATAIACGSKTYNHAIGVDAKRNKLESCAEVAKKSGKKVGIVTTVTINHATPSGFYAHRPNRGEGYNIGLDLLSSGFDYFAGGGLDGHNDRNNHNYKGDIYELAKQQGIKFVREDLEGFKALKKKDLPCWYVASSREMTYAIDRTENCKEPTLAEMTAKGIELLKDNKKGFFMMVEGGKIDYAGHANDAGTNLRETLAFDDAVRVGYEFAKKHPDTLIVVTGDHETGGMAMGFASMGYAFYMDRLVNQKCSCDELIRRLKAAKVKTLEEAGPILAESYGLKLDGDKNDPMYLNQGERNALKNALKHDLKLAEQGVYDNAKYDAVRLTAFPTEVKSIMSHKCGIGWASIHHTALPVITSAYGKNAERFGGLIDNTEIAVILKDLVR